MTRYRGLALDVALLLGAVMLGWWVSMPAPSFVVAGIDMTLPPVRVAGASREINPSVFRVRVRGTGTRIPGEVRKPAEPWPFGILAIVTGPGGREALLWDGSRSMVLRAGRGTGIGSAEVVSIDRGGMAVALPDRLHDVRLRWEGAGR